MAMPDPRAELGLGIDAGGSRTRWALATPDGAIVAEGERAGMSALQFGHAAGRDAAGAILVALTRDVLAAGQPTRVCAGMTGLGGNNGNDGMLVPFLADMLGVAPAAVALRTDIEIAYLDCFAPGEGYLVYAGTGSIAAWIDAQGQFHRAGGRGVTLDDGGGGFWIARGAMRRIWRREDEQPGAWQTSAMACAVFAQIGGSDWDRSRQFIYGQDRGAVGRLALAVAASAGDGEVDGDEEAADILRQAGQELARIALALVGRYGARPVVLGGRAADLHPLIAQAMRAALPADLPLRQQEIQPHHAAARIALASATFALSSSN
jgi:N-acetylglucosamine kinase-like BadF-type ATPase